MISLQQFINNTNGQALLYPPNSESLRGQCFQLVQYYVTQVWGTPPIWKTYAYQIMQADPNQYTVTVNNPNDPNQVPPVGAVIVFSPTLPGSGGAGHTSILCSINAGAHTFTSYDSNWGGRTAHYVTHDWRYVLGWITPKRAPVVQAAATTNTNNEEEMITSDDQAAKMYKLLRPNGQPSDGEIQSTTNHRTYVQFVNDAQNEVNQRDQALRDQAAHLTDQQNLINQQNATISNLTTSGANTKEQYDEAIAKIADLNAQLATKHDLLSDLQAKITAATTAAPAAQDTTSETTDEAAPATTEKAPSWSVRFISWVLARKNKA